MNTQIGERYQCSDSKCGCEIQITSPGRNLDESSIGGSQKNLSSAGSESGSTDESKVGSLRDAESGGISTPGDFGSQGATGEGIFGTSGGNQRSTMSGRLGSTTVASGSRAQVSSGSGTGNTSSNEGTFSCCCGKPMHKSSGTTGFASRAAQA